MADTSLERKETVVKYNAGSVEVTLSADIVKRYLVRGKGIPSTQEIMFFMGLCRARGLNPFAGDCYLIKYGQNDPSAIIVSIDFKRAKALEQPNCTGWEKGVIVQKENGELRYSKGLVMDGEKVVGGWFKAQPEGWKYPFELEVNLKGYIKKTSDGAITKFWREENWPTMIAKVAESQGLSLLCPNALGRMYTPEEIHPGADTSFDMDISAEEVGQEEERNQEELSKFGTLLTEKIGDHEDKLFTVEAFIAETATKNQVSPDEVKASAAAQFTIFWQNFLKWEAAQKKKTEKLKETKKEEPSARQGHQEDASKPGYISETQKTELFELLDANGIKAGEFLEYIKVLDPPIKAIGAIPVGKLPELRAEIEKIGAKKKKDSE